MARKEKVEVGESCKEKAAIEEHTTATVADDGVFMKRFFHFALKKEHFV